MLFLNTDTLPFNRTLLSFSDISNEFDSFKACGIGFYSRTMLLSLCTLITFVWGLPGVSASYVPCEPCDQKAMSMCPPVRMGCQVVKEPGCGCCLTCALTEGQACGVYTGTCGQGLRCLPRSGEEKPLHALLYGKGVCMNEKLGLYKPLHMPKGKFYWHALDLFYVQ